MITYEDLKKEAAEIAEFIRYSVKEQDHNQALGFLKKYEQDPVILTLLRTFYSALPQSIEEPVIKVVNVRQKQGGYLLAVSTIDHEYLYFADQKEAVYICRLEDGIDEKEILDFFNYKNGEELAHECQAVQEDGEFSSTEEETSCSCSVCSAKDGEFHELGCPIEICPWCDSQLTGCTCRFDKLGVDEIVDEEQLLSFFELLSEKGRIPYKKEHDISYPSSSFGIEQE